MAAQACCWLWVRGRAQGPGTKPECVLESTVSQSTLPSRIGWVATPSSGIRLRRSPARMRFEINDRGTGRRVALWTHPRRRLRRRIRPPVGEHLLWCSRRTAARWALEKQREGREGPPLRVLRKNGGRAVKGPPLRDGAPRKWREGRKGPPLLLFNLQFVKGRRKVMVARLLGRGGV